MNHEEIKNALLEKQKTIGAERDALRELKYDVEDLEETCTRAYDAIQDAIDALSELV